jgi:hypothetical protein
MLCQIGYDGNYSDWKKVEIGFVDEAVTFRFSRWTYGNENHRKHRNAPCKQSVQFLNFETNGK